MLNLDRWVDSAVVIGKAGDVLTEPIVVTVERIGEARVRLGFTAQSDILILRDELTRPCPHCGETTSSTNPSTVLTVFCRVCGTEYSPKTGKAER